MRKWNEKMENIMEIVKSLEDSSLLIKGVTKVIRKEIKEERYELFDHLLGTVGAGLLKNMLVGKGEGVIRTGKKQGVQKNEEKLEQKRISNGASSFN